MSLFFLIAALFVSCNTMKYVGENELFLTENIIVVASHSKDSSTTSFTTDELYNVVKQQPNRKSFKVPFYLMIYNLSNQKRIDKKMEKNELKLKTFISKKTSKYKQKSQKNSDKINELINEANGDILSRKSTKKKAKYEKKQLKLNRKIEEDTSKVIKKPLGEVLRSIGEPPTILDSNSIAKTVSQMNILLINRGYFNNTVKDSIVLHKKYNDSIPSKKKYNTAKVIYTIVPNKPYVVNYYDNDVKDSVLKNILANRKESKIEIGKNFNTDQLDEERKIVTQLLLENGYYHFNKEFIYFKVDSTCGNKKMDITMSIQNFKYKDIGKDSVLERQHTQYKVKNIDYYIGIQPKDTSTVAKTSIRYYPYYKDSSSYITFHYSTKLKYKPSLLSESVLIEPGLLYKRSDEEKTYKKLSSLGVFKNSAIIYPASNEKDKTVSPKIFSYPSKSQSFTAAADGKHFSGLYGITGSFMYSHNNLFGGAEKLVISIAGGLEMQRLIFQSDSASSIIGDIPRIYNTFNTAEFGPRISLTFPRFLFLKKYSRKFSNAKTEISGSLNYQRRPDFTRGIEEFSFGWIWKEKTKITHRLNPIIISAIGIKKSAEFQARIDELNDRFLAASYQDHIIAGAKYSFSYIGKDLKKRHSNDFISTVELAGNALRTIYNISGRPVDNESTNSYNLFNIRFAQFAKLSVDYRHTYRVSKDRRKKVFVVYRAAGGIGIPLTNLSEALPFEKSFLAGGANGMRAWKVRTLGPGSYFDPNFRFDKIGDIQLENNLEIRFPLLKSLDGAFFVDAGNIWLLNEDSLRIGGKFKKETFISEIAIGAGFGLRVDIDFFIVRLDFAVPIKNPSLTPGNRWFFNDALTDERRRFFSPQFNLGIGLPF